MFHMEQVGNPESSQALADDYLDWLRSPEGGDCVDAKLLADGRWVGYRRLLFHYTLLIGMVGDRLGYDDRYCYQHLEMVRAAFAVFDGRAEPLGWHKHPNTGRRRPDGNPAREYVEW